MGVEAFVRMGSPSEVQRTYVRMDASTPHEVRSVNLLPLTIGSESPHVALIWGQQTEGGYCTDQGCMGSGSNHPDVFVIENGLHSRPDDGFNSPRDSCPSDIH